MHQGTLSPPVRPRFGHDHAVAQVGRRVQAEPVVRDGEALYPVERLCVDAIATTAAVTHAAVGSGELSEGAGPGEGGGDEERRACSENCGPCGQTS